MLEWILPEYEYFLSVLNRNIGGRTALHIKLWLYDATQYENIKIKCVCTLIKTTSEALL